jgi:1,4-alpha-glucan branching enzyme
MIRRSRLFGAKTRVTFSLTADQPAGIVSVVGTFNNWTPGSHQLVARRDGSRSVSVSLPPGEHRFRYLATDGVWFDDHAADEIDHHGGTIRL